VTGTSDLEKLIGENKFSYPKPVNLIEYLIRMVTHKNKDAVIVDFFAGSGTTAEAVFKLNNEDKGKRRFLICTNNENNICQSITIPRVSIALNKYFKLSNTLFNPNLIVLEQDFIELSESTEQSKYNLQINIENIIAMYEETFLIIKKNDYYTSYKNFREDKIIFIYKNFYNKKQFNNMIEEIGKFKIKVILYVYDNDIEELINSSNIVNILYIKTFKEKYFDRYKSIIDEIKWG
jgi:adenine-specific DNA-methyltransferase